MQCGGEQVPSFRGVLGDWTFHADWALALIITVGVVSAWRGSWLILDAQLWPQNPVGSALVGLLAGIVLFFILVVLQPFLADWAGKTRCQRLLWFADGLYSYAGLWVCVFTWRGVWQLWDAATGFSLLAGPPDAVLAASGWLSHGVGSFVLMVIGALRSLNAPPMLIAADTSKPLFGAAVTPGLVGFMRVGRFSTAPELQTAAAWCDAVGRRSSTPQPPAV